MSDIQGRLYMQQVKRNNISQVLFTGLVATAIILSTMGSASAVELSDLFDDNTTQSTKADFLKVDQAFTVVPMLKGNMITLSLEITPGYYLYKDKFALKLPEGVSATPFIFSQSAHSINDPNFGRVQIFDQNLVTATATLTNTTQQTIQQDATLTWQGCAKAGLCYPPQKLPLALNLAPVPSHSVPATAATNSNKSTDLKPATVNTDAKAKDTPNPKKSVAVSTKDESAQKPIVNKPIHENVEPSQQKTVQQETLSPVNGSSETNSSPPSNLDAISSEETDLLTIENDANNSALTDNAVLTNSVITNSDTLASSNGLNTDAKSNSVINSDIVIDTDPFGLATYPWLALALLFLAGLGLAFTPCILPMLPIVSNIIARQHNPSAKKGLLLSGSYALGVSIAYGLLGSAIAVFGESLGIIGWLQNPLILIGFAIVFVLLALYMLDLVKLTLPNRLKQKLQTYSQVGDNYLGSNFGSFIAGFLSALVVSPCVSAPLFGALLAVSTIGNPFLGFAALFMLGLGLSAPLMLLGVSQGNLMPKAGAWMDRVKQGFALLLLGVALLLIARVLISPIMLVLWAAWFAIVASWMWHWQGETKPFAKAIAFLLLIWTACLLVGAAAGSRDAWQPLAVIGHNEAFNSRPLLTKTLNNPLDKSVSSSGNNTANRTPHNSDIRITKLDDLMPILEQYDKVLVDVTAEWCIECRIMDKTLFTNQPSALTNWQIVRLDITESNADSEQVLKQLRLFGPPALLYFVEGTLKVQQVGTISRKDFENTLAKL